MSKKWNSCKRYIGDVLSKYSQHILALSVLFSLVFLIKFVYNRFIQTNPNSILSNLLIGIFSSLIATILFITISSIISKKFRWLFVKLQGFITHSDIEYVYENKKEAYNDILADLSKSSKAFLITSRGNDLDSDLFNTFLKNRPASSRKELKVILPDINSSVGQYWIEERRKELVKFNDVKYQDENSLLDMIRRNIALLQGFVNSKRLDLQLRSFPHTGRILLTDDYCYFTPYNRDRDDDFDPVMKYNRGNTYKSYRRYFDLLWNEK